jgi:hypothetical protein
MGPNLQMGIFDGLLYNAQKEESFTCRRWEFLVRLYDVRKEESVICGRWEFLQQARGFWLGAKETMGPMEIRHVDKWRSGRLPWAISIQDVGSISQNRKRSRISVFFFLRLLT